MRVLLRSVSAVAVGGLALAGCVRNPATGGRQLVLVSEAREIQIGREYDPQVAASLGLYPDSSLQAYVQELGARLAATSERPTLPWTFRVVDDPVVNAFALPGGFIYVTRGILAHFESEAQLAAVLGHEIGHVTARHSVSRMSTQQLAQIGLVVGSVLSPELAGYADVASAGLQVLFLKNSRDDERQADDLGLRYMRRRNYDPRAMPPVFTMLERVSEAAGGGRVPEWLATHPNPENRRERIEQALTASREDFGSTIVGREPYLRRLQGLVYGDNPREGYFRGSEFLHPELAFRFAFPDGWSTSNQKQAVVAVSPQQDAVVQITLARDETPELAARAFFSQEGVSGGPAVRAEIHGLPAATGAFVAVVEGGRLRGAVAFVAHGGAVFRLLAYSMESRWPTYRAAVEPALRSFRRLTDPAVLAVQPLRLEIVTLDRAMTIREFAERFPTAASVERLALINQVALDSRLEAGALLKRVVGQPVP